MAPGPPAGPGWWLWRRPIGKLCRSNRRSTRGRSRSCRSRETGCCGRRARLPLKVRERSTPVAPVEENLATSLTNEQIARRSCGGSESSSQGGAGEGGGGGQESGWRSCTRGRSTRRPHVGFRIAGLASLPRAPSVSLRASDGLHPSVTPAPFCKTVQCQNSLRILCVFARVRPQADASRSELDVLSERYGQRCLELRRGEQSGRGREAELGLKERELQQLRRENQVHTHLNSFLTDCVRLVGGNEQGR